MGVMIRVMNKKMMKKVSKLLPVSAKIGRGGRLNIGGCDLIELAGQFGTPLYIIDETHESSDKLLQIGLAPILDAIEANPALRLFRSPDGECIFAATR